MSEQSQQHNRQEDHVEEMGAFFDARAHDYDEHMQHLFQDHDAYYEAVAGRIRPTEEAVRILDLGCGTGNELGPIFMRTPNARITGIDMSPGMLAQLKAKYPGRRQQLELWCGSYLELAFGQGYDYVVSVYTMHHLLPEAKLALYRKIMGALKPGGLYIEGDYIVAEQTEQELLARYRRLNAGLTPERQYHIDIPLSLGTQAELLEAAGFRKPCIWQLEANAAVFTARRPESPAKGQAWCREEEIAVWANRQWPVPFIDSALEVASGKLWRLDACDGSRWYLKRTSGEAQALRELLVSGVLADSGIRSPRYLTDRRGRLAGAREGQWFVLYQELAGTVRGQVSPEEAAVFGEGLARLHSALEGRFQEGELRGMNLQQELEKGAFSRAMDMGRLTSWEREQLRKLADEMSGTWFPLMNGLPKQPIHRDAHPGNMVLGEDGAVGFLDFELSTIGSRLFDLCYFATSQLPSGMNGAPSAWEAWIRLLGCLREGYERISPLLPEERSSVFYMMSSIQFIFVAYFVENGQTEAAEQNMRGLFSLLTKRGHIDSVFA